jgi:hypothetical protein
VVATAAFVYGAFDFFLGAASPFLDTANQFIFFALDELQIVIRQLRKFLFQLALGNVPVSFGGKSAHIILVCFLFLPRDSAARILFASGVPRDLTNNFSAKPSI